jgi:hypothetical protein
VIENNQRQDVHPLEEALGYQSLMQPPHKFTADQIADKIGRGRRYVFNRLKLLDLTEAAREALYAEQIDATVALYLARVPAALQPQALEELTRRESGITARAARELIEDQFMLHLGDAPFDIKSSSYIGVQQRDGKTTHIVGPITPCGACPKRTGANPDLFADVESKDMCTDPQCYDAKRIAHNDITINAARKKMMRIIEGDEAKKLMPHQYFKKPPEYQRMDASLATCADDSYLTGFADIEFPDDKQAEKTVRELIGKDAAARGLALFIDPHTGNAYEVMPNTVVAGALKKAGLLIEPKDKTSTAAPANSKYQNTTQAELQKKREAEQAQREQDRAIRRAIFDAVRKKMHAAIDTCGGIPTLEDVRAIALALCQEYSIANALLDLELCKPQLTEQQLANLDDLDPPEILRIHIAQLDAPALFKLMFDATLADTMNQTYWGNNADDAPDPLAAAAKRHNIDTALIASHIKGVDKKSKSKNHA